LDNTGSIISFLAEFSAFEKHSVGQALRSLSKNDLFSSNAEKMLDLEAGIRLIKRMAFVRDLDPAACNEIGQIEERAKQLAAKRDELVHTSRVAAEFGNRDSLSPPQEVQPGVSRTEREVLKTVWRPTIAEIDQYRNDTIYMRSSLTAILERLQHRAT
jgi:hypothetical protein